MGLPGTVQIVTLVLLLPLVLCTQFEIPGSWTGTRFNVSQSDRLQIAQSALSILRPSINASTGTIANFVIEGSASLQWVIATQDWLSNSTTNQKQVTSNFATYEQTDKNFVSGQPNGYMSDALFWGVSSYYAYRAYKDPVFLNYAKVIWDTVAIYSVTPAQAATGNSSVRNVTFQSTCNGATTAGAVFLDSAAENDLVIAGQTLGLFLTLSAYLFEQSGNTTYKAYADLTTAFIQTNLFNGQVILDGYDIGSCTVTSASTAVYTHSTGLTIEGWAVFANVTNNSTLKGIVDNLVYNSVTSSTWTNTAGVNFEEPDTDLDDYYNGFKSFFIRGLHTAWQRDDPTSDVAQLIAAYITIQFNALQNQAAQAPQSNFYSSKWFGGPPSSFQPYSQVIALHVLNPAFNLPDNAVRNITTSPGNHTSTDNNNNPSDHSHVGAIVGGLVGGIGGLALMAILAFFLWRRKKRSGPRPVLDPDERTSTMPWTEGEVEPFLLPAPALDPAASVYQRYATEKVSSAPATQHVSPRFNDNSATMSGPGSDISSSGAPSHSQARSGDAPASAAELQRLSEQVNGLISSLAASQNAQHQPSAEQPPMYEPRYNP